MKFTKLRDVKSPTRANATDAGIDFYVPEEDEAFIQDFEKKNPGIRWESRVNAWQVDPGDSVLIPSGVKVRFDPGHALVAFNKSGVAVKKGLSVMACVVDETYMGEVHLSLVNATNSFTYVYPGEKIVQFLLLPINYSQPEEVETEEKLYEGFKSSRGEGGFGSSGV